RKLRELDDLIDRAAGIIPETAPEAEILEEAAEKVEAATAAIALRSDQPKPSLRKFLPPLPPFDLKRMQAEIARVERALNEFKARVAELREQEDEEILLLLEDD